MRKQTEKVSKEKDMVARLTLYPFGRLAFKFNIDAKVDSFNIDDIRTMKRNKKDLKITVKILDSIETFYIARSKLNIVENLELEIVDA